MQNFTDIQPTETLAASLSELTNNDKSVASSFSGTAFPTTNLEVGMRCHRTDLSKTYWLSSDNPITWNLLIDHNKTIQYKEDPLGDATVKDATVGTLKINTEAKAYGAGSDSAVGNGFHTLVDDTTYRGFWWQLSAGNYADFWLGDNSASWKRMIRVTTTTMSFTGAITATSDITGNSDKRLKFNIEPIDSAAALDMVCRWRGYTFNRNDLEDEPKQAGFIAQDVQLDAPELVKEDEDGILSLAYGASTAYLAAAMVALREQIDALRRELNTLKAA